MNQAILVGVLNWFKATKWPLQIMFIDFYFSVGNRPRPHHKWWVRMDNVSIS